MRPCIPSRGGACDGGCRAEPPDQRAIAEARAVVPTPPVMRIALMGACMFAIASYPQLAEGPMKSQTGLGL